MWGPRGEWCDIRPCFICSESLLALLRAVLGKASSGAMAGREKEAKEEGGGDGEARGQRVSRLPLRAQGAQNKCRGLSGESGPTSLQTRLFIIHKQLAFLSVLCHWEVGVQAGERPELGAV